MAASEAAALVLTRCRLTTFHHALARTRDASSSGSRGGPARAAARLPSGSPTPLAELAEMADSGVLKPGGCYMLTCSAPPRSSHLGAPD